MGSGPLIASKLAIPRRRADMLRRARLVDAIKHMDDRQLYLVVAPPGFGKTTLLVDFASDSDIPVCWYTLGPSDAEPAVFLEYLVACIQARFPGFGRATRRVLAQAILPGDGMAVVDALVKEIDQRIPSDFSIVLDDYHEVNRSPTVNQLVDALLKQAPENLKLAISSQTMPRLQLSRLAALRRAAGVGAKDLRFTPNEVRDLMRDTYSSVLTERVIEELTARSEGWITGILLTAHTMWQGLFESMIRNSGQEELFGYLAGEVFERQTPAVRRFLLASSVLEEMTPAVAAAVSGSSRAGHILSELERTNLFVSSTQTARRSYRYHQLFREFLRSRLDDAPSGLSRSEFERRAGLAYQERGRHEQAIPYLLAASAFEQAAESILAIAEGTVSRSQMDVLAGWSERLPEATLWAKTRLSARRKQLAAQWNAARRRKSHSGARTGVAAGGPALFEIRAVSS